MKANFRVLIGKVISINDTTLLLAKNIKYSSNNIEFEKLTNEFNDNYSWDY